jgi:hypothetical protein
VVCLQRQLALHFTVCHLTSTSIGANRTVMRWCILAIQAFTLEMLGETGRLRSVSHHNWIAKMWFTCPCCTHHDTLSTHHCKNVFTDIFCFTIQTTLLCPYILDANNKCSLVGQLPIHLWGRGISLDILVTTTTHIIPVTVYVTQNWSIITRISSSWATCCPIHSVF